MGREREAHEPDYEEDEVGGKGDPERAEKLEKEAYGGDDDAPDVPLPG